MFRCILFFILVLGTHLNAADELNWYTNYPEAVKASKASSKPILLFFTGSDWCGWCKKLDKEVFDTKEFATDSGDKYIFVKVDFPQKNSFSAAINEQNNHLKNKYSISGYPTVIIIDSAEQEIGITGYRAGGPKKYSEHLKQLTDEFSKFKDKMSKLDEANLSGKDLKKLYQKAREYGLEKESLTIVEKGVQSDAPHFFLSELYRQQVLQNSPQNPKTIALKEKILSSDPNNTNLCHYQIAVIDFESNCEKMQNGACSADACVAPLVGYLNTFGGKNNDHEWRLNMVISQVYLDQEKYRESLKYAEAAHEAAPKTVQPEIASAIRNIQGHLQGPQ